LLCGLLLVGSAATTVRHDHGHAAESHDHLLVFGFEVYEGELPSPGGTTDGPGEVGVSVGLAADDGRDAIPTPVPAPPAVPPAGGIRPAASTLRPAPLPARCHVCDSARGKRSGVRLA
jgi:hypothetical protein